MQFIKLNVWKFKIRNMAGKSRRNANSIQEAMKMPIYLAQIFGLFPVYFDPISFKWKSAKVAYSVLVMFLSLFTIITSSYHYITVEITFEKFTQFVFEIGGLVSTVLFVKLAKDWTTLMATWGRVDKIMEANYGYPKKLGIRLKIAALALMFFAAVEHLLSLAGNVVQTMYMYNGTVTFDNYYHSNFPQIFEHVPLNYFTVVLIQLCSVVGTFSWNYNDLFIILISSSLAFRYKQITERLRRNDKEPCIAYWMEVREDYDRLCSLCRKLDLALSYLVMNSFATNIFFILVQLFNSLRTIEDSVEKIYFFYSFGFLITRTILVSLYGASINNESKEPLHVLNSVPTNCYNNEVRRFIVQVSNDSVALTGCQIFRVTRGLILNLAGAIVTYELVLIQFNIGALKSTT